MSYQDWHERPGYYRDITRHFDHDMSLLDIGCGTAWMAEEFPSYAGTELDAAIVAEARARGVDVRLAGPSGTLPFEDDQFDGVVLKDVLEHLPNPMAMVAEVRRVLRAGGLVFASSPDAQRTAWHDYTHLRPYTRTSMRRLWLDHGMTVEKVAYETVMPGSSRISHRTRNHRRPWFLQAAGHVPFIPRNVWILARKPATR